MNTHLTLQTTLEDFEHCHGFDRDNGPRRERWTGFKKMVQLILAEGGELWEWEADHIMGNTGLAVVRNGEVIKQWKLA